MIVLTPIALTPELVLLLPVPAIDAEMCGSRVRRQSSCGHYAQRRAQLVNKGAQLRSRTQSQAPLPTVHSASITRVASTFCIGASVPNRRLMSMGVARAELPLHILF